MPSHKTATDPRAAAPASGVADLAAELQLELDGVERELHEMGMLLQQAQAEAERHEARATAAAERAAQLDAESSSTEAREARQAVLLQTRRAALMAGQVQVLEGKQRTMRRVQDRLRQTIEKVAALDHESATEGAPSRPPASARAVLAAQEQMRREIAREMHDGPAQSIANIALQAQVVQQLMRRDPKRAEAELTELSAMVQHALDATKSFIFEVRPMVLDDLGIVPTLRRAARDKSQRSGIPIRFESAGTDRRLEAEIESNLFRIIDDAITGFVLGQPREVHVRLDWAEDSLAATVHSRAVAEADGETAGAAEPAAAKPGEEPPPALAAMIDEQRARARAGAAARRQARALPPETWSEIQERAASVSIAVELLEEGRLLKVGVQVPTT